MPSYLCCRGGYKPGKDLWVCQCPRDCTCTYPPCDACVCGDASGDLAVVTLVRVIQTCDACPSQWDAWDDTGGYWYLRYRYGRGQARQYASGPDWTWGPDGGEEPRRTLVFEHGNALDGVISLEKFAGLASLVLSPELQKS